MTKQRLQRQTSEGLGNSSILGREVFIMLHNVLRIVTPVAWPGVHGRSRPAQWSICLSHVDFWQRSLQACLDEVRWGGALHVAIRHLSNAPTAVDELAPSSTNPRQWRGKVDLSDRDWLSDFTFLVKKIHGQDVAHKRLHLLPSDGNDNIAVDWKPSSFQTPESEKDTFARFILVTEGDICSIKQWRRTLISVFFWSVMATFFYYFFTSHSTSNIAQQNGRSISNRYRQPASYQRCDTRPKEILDKNLLIYSTRRTPAEMKASFCAIAGPSVDHNCWSSSVVADNFCQHENFDSYQLHEQHQQVPRLFDDNLNVNKLLLRGKTVDKWFFGLDDSSWGVRLLQGYALKLLFQGIKCNDL